MKITLCSVKCTSCGRLDEMPIRYSGTPDYLIGKETFAHDECPTCKGHNATIECVEL